MSDYVKTTWATGDVISAQKLNNAETGIGNAHTELGTHISDNTKHVSKDGTLQTGLNVDKADGIHFRNTGGTLEWSPDETTWNPCGSAGIRVYADNAAFSGSKKSDTQTCSGQCVYASVSGSGNVQLTDLVLDKADLGTMTLILRVKTGNNALTADVIKVDIQRNNNGTYASIATKNFKPNVFSKTTDYECIFVPFDYNGGRATNNQLKVVVTLLQNATVFEVDLDYISVMPQVIGIVG